MSHGYLYIWMEQLLPRRKGGPPAGWKPVGFVEPHDDVDHLAYCVDRYNSSGRPCPADANHGRQRARHAVFRVPASCLEQVHPAPACPQPSAVSAVSAVKSESPT